MLRNNIIESSMHTAFVTFSLIKTCPPWRKVTQKSRRHQGMLRGYITPPLLFHELIRLHNIATYFCSRNIVSLQITIQTSIGIEQHYEACLFNPNNNYPPR